MFSSVKEKIKGLKNSRFISGRFIYYSLRRCWFVMTFFSNKRYRSELITKYFQGEQIHQPSTFTLTNRYPLIFNHCADYLSARNNPHILSFGCSSGEEVNILDGKLKSGGLLIVDQSDFSFTDTVCSEKYTPLVSFERNRIVRNRPLFDKNNRKVAESQNSYRVFVKC